jgi:hypothetical protein
MASASVSGLGLILGTRMYYKFDPPAVATEAAFSEQMDAVIREVGVRGHCEAIPESVPPSKTPAPAPAPTPAPAPARARAPGSAAAISQQDSTRATVVPSLLQQSPTTEAVQLSTAGAAVGGAAMDVAMFLDLVDRLQAKAAAERQTMESTIEQFRTEQQIMSLQTRLAALHALGLLELDELNALEDIVEDSLDSAGNTTSGADDRALRMAAMSVRTAVDANFSRQLRRKFLG